MKIFNSTSIYDCIFPLFQFSKMFGLAPITLPRDGKALKTSFCDYLIFIICESVCLFVFFEILTNCYLTKQSESMIFNIGGILALLSALIIAIISIFMAMINRLKMYKVFNAINSCDEKVKKLFKFI